MAAFNSLGTQEVYSMKQKKLCRLLVWVAHKHKPKAPYTSIFAYLAYVVDRGIIWWVKEVWKRRFDKETKKKVKE